MPKREPQFEPLVVGGLLDQRTTIPELHVHQTTSHSAYQKLGSLLTSEDLVSRVIAGLVRRKPSPWLVIVITFADDALSVFRQSKKTDVLRSYKRVFTSEGTGQFNLVDFFLDMTHGVLDLSDSKVVGPFRLARPRSDYVGNTSPVPNGKLDRGGILNLGKATAAAHGHDLSKYAGVVVCGTPTLDLCGWVGGMAALCDDLGLAPSLLGQEVGHGYGLDHSRRDGSSDDYMDPWDTMSTANAYSAPHSEFGSIGPGLNAWNMRLRGWLDEDRVINVAPGSRSTVKLKPLHDWPSGTIAINIKGFLIEFRINERWDAGIPRPCVLVHRVVGNTSFLVASTSGNFDLVQGERFEWGSPALGLYLSVEVEDLDVASRTATISVVHGVVHIPQTKPDWLKELHPLPPVEEPSVLRRLIDDYEAVTVIAGRFGQPELQLRALGDIAEEIGRLASKVEVITNHPGFSFDPSRQSIRSSVASTGSRSGTRGPEIAKDERSGADSAGGRAKRSKEKKTKKPPS